MKKTAVIFFTIFSTFIVFLTPLSAQTTSIPVLTTGTVSDINTTFVTCGGNITGDGGSAITAKGLCWSTGNNPTINDKIISCSENQVNFSAKIYGLTANTVYHMRAYATNSNGTGYGNTVSFTTKQWEGTVTDIDGNVYHTVTIGNQVWMVENLKTTRYCNGDTLHNLIDTLSWNNSETGAYCDYNNDTAISAVYGKLYNWYTVIDQRGIAPAGWRIPDDSDWTILKNYCGGLKMAGMYLKEAGNAHWLIVDSTITNSSGFSALPGGRRKTKGLFEQIGTYGYWWSTTPEPDIWAGCWHLGNDYTFGESYMVYRYGVSIRCIKGLKTDVQKLGGEISGYSLSQNYPNPFNPRTTINYSLIQTGHVTIKIFDVLGREVATLVNEKQNSGNYLIAWEPKNVTSGIYFYQLRSGKYNEIKKMMYLK